MNSAHPTKVSRLVAPRGCSSYLRLIDSCITQVKAQGPARTCKESKEAEDEARLFLMGEVPLYGELMRGRVNDALAIQRNLAYPLCAQALACKFAG